MSWSIKTAGTKDNVKAVIDTNEHIPPLVKDLIKTQVDQLQVEPRWSGDTLEYQVFVETWGHVDQETMEVNVKVNRVASGVKPKEAPTDE